MTIFGDYLRGIREERGLTLREVAETMGVSAAMLSRIENGKRGIPGDERLYKLAEILAIDIKELETVVLESEEEERRRRYQVFRVPALGHVMQFVEGTAAIAEVPILSKITPKNALLYSEHIVGRRLIVVENTESEYFYFQATDDSMKGAGVDSGDYVLIELGNPLVPGYGKVNLMTLADEPYAMLRRVTYSEVNRLMIIEAMDNHVPPMLIPRSEWSRDRINFLGVAVRVEKTL